jgi:serine-type D-Ala-D-Ala endopeptidase (penicillin-binding protein 7)
VLRQWINQLAVKWSRIACWCLLAALCLVQVDAAWAKRTEPVRGKKVKVAMVHGQRVIWPHGKRAAAHKRVLKQAPVVLSKKSVSKADRKQLALYRAKAPPRVVILSARRAGGGRRVAVRRMRAVRVARVVQVPRVQRHSVGHVTGLATVADPLSLNSSVALVVDQETNEVLFEKNTRAVLPIASLTKLMTALVVSEAKLPLQETLSIDAQDIDTEKGSRSRLALGTELTREEMLHLALMSSENRAAHALARHYRGGVPAFVAAMNQRAQALGMRDTHYVDPTGLSSDNQSSARDLAVLVKTAYGHALIRELSTSPEHHVFVGERQLRFHNTNRLVLRDAWDIGLQKTGYISEAGRCLVMQAKLAGRPVIMVFLDAHGRYGRIEDAERVRRWMEASAGAPTMSETAELAMQGRRF